MPIVSVIIPAYNAARWIAETIDSVLVQTFRDFEVIVVDDGSTDETPEIVAKYGNSVRHVRKENGGESSARNAGVRAAHGKYVAFVDADDLWLPEKIELQMKLFTKCPDLAWAYCDALVFDGQTNQVLWKISDTTKPYEGDILRPLLLDNFIGSPTPIIRRDVFDVAGYFDESPLIRIGPDWDMWLRIAAKHAIGYVAQPLAKYRWHSSSMTGTTGPQYTFESKLRVIENAVAREPKRLADLRGRAIANLCTIMGKWMVKRNEDAKAREMFIRAIRYYPYDIRILAYWLATFLPVPFLRRTVDTLRQL